MASKFLLVLVIIILLTCETFVDARAQETCTDSTQPTVVEICQELQKAQIPEGITRKEFRYENPRPNVSIAIEPKGAFTIEKLQSASGSAFLIKIVEPSLLFRVVGELTRPVRINLEEKTGVLPPIRIDADSRCETILEFNQAGRPLNLENLASGYNLEWVYPANLLSKPEVFGTQIRVKRLKQGEATVTLIVRDGTDEIARATRPVLDCSGLPPSSPSPEEAVMELMTPERCFKLYSTRSTGIANGHRYFYTVQNVCSKPIQCQWDVRVQHYTSLEDADNDLRIGDLSTGRPYTSGRASYGTTIPGRKGSVNGESRSTFDIITTERITGEVTQTYWHTLTVPNCSWSDYRP